MHCRSLIGAAENARRTGKTERLDSDELLNDARSPIKQNFGDWKTADWKMTNEKNFVGL